MMMLIIYVILILIEVIVTAEYGSLAHELGHFREACKYAKTKAEINVLCHLPLPKIKDVHIVRGKKTEEIGYIELENGFFPYTKDQIREIAMAGHREAFRFFADTALITQMIGLVAYLMSNGAGFLYFIVFSVYVWVFCIIRILFGYIAYLNGKNKEGWTDYKICHDPQGFRVYKASQP